MTTKTAKKSTKKKDLKVPVGIVNIQATFNNAIITITDLQGNVVSWASAGTLGFKGSRKGTPFAAQQAAAMCGQEAVKHGMKRVHVRVKGPGAGRESAIRALQSIGLEIKSIKDVTPIPHNGLSAT
jgi:small subunit ribosomal protein S11